MKIWEFKIESHDDPYYPYIYLFVNKPTDEDVKKYVFDVYFEDEDDEQVVDLFGNLDELILHKFYQTSNTNFKLTEISAIEN